MQFENIKNLNLAVPYMCLFLHIFSLLKKGKARFARKNMCWHFHRKIRKQKLMDTICNMHVNFTWHFHMIPCDFTLVNVRFVLLFSSTLGITTSQKLIYFLKLPVFPGGHGPYVPRKVKKNNNNNNWIDLLKKVLCWFQLCITQAFDFSFDKGPFSLKYCR